MGQKGSERGDYLGQIRDRCGVDEEMVRDREGWKEKVRVAIIEIE